MNQKSSHASFNFQNLYKHEITKIKSSIFQRLTPLTHSNPPKKEKKKEEEEELLKTQ